MQVESKDSMVPKARLFREWMAGGVANAITSAILNPMDVAKTRLQIVVDKPCNKNFASVLFSTLKNAYASGGLWGLWRPGLSATMIRELMSSGPRAGFYVPVRSVVCDWFQCSVEDAILYPKIIAAMVTGIMGSILANPIDVIKIRMMVNETSYKTVYHGMFSIYDTEGIAGFYKGVVPSTLRGAFIAGRLINIRNLIQL